jgi:uncharacterized sulfatase
MTTFRSLITLGAIFAVCLSAPAADAPKPNIIFILADDLGYGDLGCYGQKKIQTPCLDRMVADGMRFTQFYAGSTVCAPSRCVLMTGQNTGHCWVRGNAGKNNAQGQILRAQDVTVAKVLHGAGYATALIGKWGLGEPDTSGLPRRQGFDYFYGYLSQFHAHNYYPAFLWRNEARVPLKNEVPPGSVGYGEAEFGQGWATKRVEYSHDLFVADALKWVEQNRSKPFFLYLAITTPHANNEGARGTGNGQEVPDYGIYKDKDWAEPNKGQAAMITRMDHDIGRLLAKLKQLNLDERTLVLFSSDNGHHKEGGNDPEFFDANGPLRGMKRDLYDGGIRVPFIARWPGRIKAGVVSDHVGYFGDFMVTAAELAGVEPPPNLDSVSFAPTLLGQPERQKRHDYLYWEFHERGFAQAVRLGDWKAVRFGTKKPVELYDIKNDLGEERNAAAQHPEVVAKVEAILKTARTDSEFFPIREFAPKKAGAKKKP